MDPEVTLLQSTPPPPVPTKQSKYCLYLFTWPARDGDAVEAPSPHTAHVSSQPPPAPRRPFTQDLRLQVARGWAQRGPRAGKEPPWLKTKTIPGPSSHQPATVHGSRSPCSAQSIKSRSD